MPAIPPGKCVSVNVRRGKYAMHLHTQINCVGSTQKCVVKMRQCKRSIICHSGDLCHCIRWNHVGLHNPATGTEFHVLSWGRLPRNGFPRLRWLGDTTLPTQDPYRRAVFIFDKENLSTKSCRTRPRLSNTSS